MKTHGNIHSAIRVPVWIPIMAALLIGIPTGCGQNAGQPAGQMAKDRHAAVTATRIPVRIVPWEPLGHAPEDDAMVLVKAVVAGDLAGVDAVLSRGQIGVDDVLCLSIDEGLRRGRIDTDRTQFCPPDITARGSADYSHLFYCYSVTARQDPALGKNESLSLYGTPLMLAARAGRTDVVAFLLKRGANPNVFIPVRGVDEQTVRDGIGRRRSVSLSRPWAVLCALTDCFVRTGGKRIEDEEDCAALLLRHGAVMPPDNACGQSALWAAAQARSPYLLELFLDAGADLGHRDNLGMTVTDYMESTLKDVHDEPLLGECKAFLQALQTNGAVSGSSDPVPGAGLDSSPVPEQAIPRNPALSGPSPTEFPGRVPTEKPQDHPAEIAALEIRLVELRSQLDDARLDARLNAIRGITPAATQMRIQMLISQIHDCESQLLELQE